MPQPILVAIDRITKDYDHNITKSVEKVILFDDRGKAHSFVENFKHKWIPDTEISFDARLVEYERNTEPDLVFELSIQGNRVSLLSHWVSNFSSPLMQAIRNEPNEAFRENKHGEIVKLDGANLSIHSWFTMSPLMQDELMREIREDQ